MEKGLPIKALYPGNFTPPSNVYFNAIMEALNKYNISEINIIISKKGDPSLSITAEDNYKIFDIIKNTNGIQRMNIRISSYDTPVKDIFEYLENNKNENILLMVNGMKSYADTVKSRYGKRVTVYHVPLNKDDQNFLVSLIKKNRHLIDKIKNMSPNDEDYNEYLSEIKDNLSEIDEFYQPFYDRLKDSGKIYDIYKLLGMNINNEIISESYNYNQPVYYRKDNLYSEVMKFVSFCKKFLSIKSKIRIELIDQGYTNGSYAHVTVQELGHDYEHTTFLITVYIRNRDLYDIFRSIAHELVHVRQSELYGWEELDGDTGSGDENEANAIAGTILRIYGKKSKKWQKTT
ncbi:MAG: hypothetical protein IRZ03_13160 [Acidobacterium ailaaui]|nr:hypothetical protein [Pseudacidobacterium ailaaui]